MLLISSAQGKSIQRLYRAGQLLGLYRFKDAGLCRVRVSQPLPAGAVMALVCRSTGKSRVKESGAQLLMYGPKKLQQCLQSRVRESATRRSTRRGMVPAVAVVTESATRQYRSHPDPQHGANPASPQPGSASGRGQASLSLKGRGATVNVRTQEATGLAARTTRRYRLFGAILSCCL